MNYLWRRNVPGGVAPKPTTWPQAPPPPSVAGAGSGRGYRRSAGSSAARGPRAVLEMAARLWPGRAEVKSMKAGLLAAVRLCRDRGLLHAAKWSAELAFCLDPLKPEDGFPTPPPFTAEDLTDFEVYTVAKAYFDLKEFDRAAHSLKDCRSPQAYFLHMYSRYLAGEKKKEDDSLDSHGLLGKAVNYGVLRVLRVELSKKHCEGQLDGFGLYIYGVVLRKMDLESEAITILSEATRATPLHWGAWQELSCLIPDRDKLKSLSLPDHWMHDFFLAHVYTELQLNSEALLKYRELLDAGFSRSTYIAAQMAVAYHNAQDIDNALALFSDLRKRDPYRIENMDMFSNLLYVKNNKPELSYLAHSLCEIDKYREETCYVIGNYYSLRTQHEKAALYFKRTLKLNPQYLSAWILIGHEFLEMRNTSAAIQAYRSAIAVNRRDCRAWYGLGQTYEILKMPFYCLYYYRQAHQLKPNDSRMLMAMGEIYEKLRKVVEAKKCYWRAFSVGDVEKIALVKLAKLHERLGESDQAAHCYYKYIQDMCEGHILEHEELSGAFRNLAHYYFKCKRWEDATVCARRCCSYNDTREEGKALLRQISQLRAEGEASNVDMSLDLSGSTSMPDLSPQNLFSI